MDITPLIKAGHNVIQSYGDGFLRINGQYYESAVFVMPEEVVNWPYQGGASDLDFPAFKPILPYLESLDILLIGCGAQMMRLDRTVQQALKQHNVSIDIMSTAAACRTYNVLMPEGRRLGAALLMP